MKPIDYTKKINIGDEIGTLKVLESPFRKGSTEIKTGEWHVKIRCKCGTEQCVPCVEWLRNKFKSCRNCQLIGSNNYAWNGYGEIKGQYFCKLKLEAKARKLSYKLTKKYLWDLFLKQDRKCALSGLPLQFSMNKSERTASLDRIDSSIGYEEKNVQWIHKTINIMKNGFDEKDFLRFCKMIYEHNRNRIQGEIENLSNRRRV